VAFDFSTKRILASIDGTIIYRFLTRDVKSMHQQVITYRKKVGIVSMLKQSTYQDITQLRRRLSRITLSIRRSHLDVGAVDKPFFMNDYDFYEGGRIYRRKKIILAAPGCTAATCTMCPIPNEAFYGLRLKLTAENFVQQFYAAFSADPIDSYQLISVYNSGNWFANREIPPLARQHIYQTIAHSHCEGLMVESLPQFITPQLMEDARTYLGNKRLIVAIGLQSVNDTVRNVCVNTTCTKEQFERASRLLWEYGYTARVYLMVKPPFLTEKEAIVDTVASIRYAAKLGYEDVSICPTRIAPYTLAAELDKRNLYTAPSLWTIVDILNTAHMICNIRVTCLDLDGRDSGTIYPHTCPSCTYVLLASLQAYNVQHDLSAIAALNCSCRDKHRVEKESQDKRSLLDRVSDFLEQYEAEMNVE
jgi:archaeosine synthase beta-subunit